MDGAGAHGNPETACARILGSWHPSDMLIGLDPASGLLEAMRHDLTPALGSSLDDAVDSLANQLVRVCWRPG